MAQLERSTLNFRGLEGVTRFAQTLADLFNGRISFGEPDDGNGNPRGDNIEGAWATATFTAGIKNRSANTGWSPSTVRVAAV